MKKHHHLLITGLFCVFLFSVAIISLILPDRSFSELENRNLRQLPEISMQRIRSGKYMTEVESYLSDQIAFRDMWVTVKAAAERLTGKLENNGICFADDDTLIKLLDVPDQTLLAQHVDYLNAFAENADVPVYFGLIPTAASVWEDKLPIGAPTADESGIIAELYGQITAKTIDLNENLLTHADEAIYYRTDHHWTSLGAYYGANSILEAMDLEPLNLEDYTPSVVSETFFGTNYSISGAFWTEPDEIVTYLPDQGLEVTSNFTGREEPGKLYVPERLGVKNKYAYFLGGNQPLCVIRSQLDGPRILVVRDSYSDCLAPFLTERFSEVHLFDLRYNRMPLKDYIEAEQIDMVLILYSFSNYVEDTNQFLLIR